MITKILKSFILIVILEFCIVEKYLYEECYSSAVEDSEVSIQIYNPLATIKSVEYPSFDDLDLLKDGIQSKTDLVISLDDHGNKEANFKLKYCWNMVDNNKKIGTNTAFSIGKGSLTSDKSGEGNVEYTSIEANNILENNVTELISIKNKGSNSYEYRIPKENISLNIDRSSDVGTHYIRQVIFLTYVQENN